MEGHGNHRSLPYSTRKLMGILLKSIPTDPLAAETKFRPLQSRRAWARGASRMGSSRTSPMMVTSTIGFFKRPCRAPTPLV